MQCVRLGREQRPLSRSGRTPAKRFDISQKSQKRPSLFFRSTFPNFDDFVKVQVDLFKYQRPQFAQMQCGAL